MSNPVIEELLNYFAGQGLTLELLNELSKEDWQSLPGPDGNPLGIPQLHALKTTVKLRMNASRPVSASLSKSSIALELEREKNRALIEQNNKLEEEKKGLVDLAHVSCSIREKVDKKKLEVTNRKNRITEILSYTKEITATNLKDVQKMVQELRALGSSLDICFCIDGTGSMSGVINSVKQCIVSVSQRIASSTGMNARFGLVVYRDYCDGNMRHQVWDFCDSLSLSSYLGTVAAQGGGDASEDCFGGLLAAQTRVNWKAPARVIVWMGDAPQHGSLYNGGAGDSYAGGDPEGLTSNVIFKNLQEKKIILVFCKLNDTTNAMIERMKQEIIPYGDGLFLQYNLGGEMTEFLASTLFHTASKTLAPSGTKGKKKAFTITPSTWAISSSWVLGLECKIYTFKAYDGGDLHPLLDILLDGANTKTRDAVISVTLNPVAEGEMRFAFYAKIEENTGYFSLRKTVKKGVVKESRFEGAHNSKKVLINQAKIQTVAQFLASEFNAKLKSLRIQAKKIIYVPVELLHIPSRPNPGNYYSLEPFIEGQYCKFNNNNGFVDRFLENTHSILQTFSHFTYCYSRGILMVTDVQGAVQTECYKLTDPAIHTANPKKELIDSTNLGPNGMSQFFSTHNCNDYCVRLKLELPHDLDTSTPLYSMRDNPLSVIRDEEEDDDAWENFDST